MGESQADRPLSTGTLFSFKRTISTLITEAWIFGSHIFQKSVSWSLQGEQFIFFFFFFFFFSYQDNWIFPEETRIFKSLDLSP